MCGRVYMAPADPELRELVKEMNRSKLAECFREKESGFLQAEGEIYPSAVLPVLAMNKVRAKRVYPMKWGFRGTKRLLINARAETASEKPTFRDSWFNHRCVIPASWYYEWDHDDKNTPAQKYALHPEQPGLIWIAGLYRIEDGIPAFVILTRPAHSSLTWMHDRMPVLLPKDEVVNWINPDSDPSSIVQSGLTAIRWRKAV